MSPTEPVPFDDDDLIEIGDPNISEMSQPLAPIPEPVVEYPRDQVGADIIPIGGHQDAGDPEEEAMEQATIDQIAITLESIDDQLKTFNIKMERLVQVAERIAPGPANMQIGQAPQAAAGTAPQAAQGQAGGQPTPWQLPSQQAQLPYWECPIHHTSRVVPAGVSKKPPFRPYDAFYVCAEQGCDQKPPRVSP